MRNGLFSEGRNPNLLMVAVFAGIFFVDFIIYMLLNAFECDYKAPIIIFLNGLALGLVFRIINKNK